MHSSHARVRLLPLMAAWGLCVALLSTPGCRRSVPAETAEGPSVLLVVIDTLRSDRIAPDDARTPNIGSWAGGAAVFTNAESSAPFTMPSMAALMTGLYPDRTGVVAHVAGAGLRTPAGWTVAEAAKAAGLATGAVVANPWLSRSSSGFARGFDAFVGRREGAGRPKHLDAASVTDAALSLLQQWQGRRFLLWLHYFDPHMPYRPPAANAAAVGAAPGASRVIDDFSGPSRDLTRLYAGTGYSPEELAAARRLYDGEVHYVDEQFGRLMQGVEALGRARDTITVVVSDHGESLGEHGLFFAHDFTVYEELTHAVLMMRGPVIAAGRREEVVSLVDVAPTLCRLLDLQCRSATDGSDLFAADGDTATRSRPVFAAAAPLRDTGARFAGLQVPGIDGRWSMVRLGNHKLVEIPTPTGSRYELYDLRADPLELNDLFAADPRSRPAHELRGLLDTWHAEMTRSRPVPSQSDPAAARKDERTLRSLGYLQ